MLVLSRKRGESIMIGDQIELVVLEMDGEAIKLGVKAPRHVDIHRKEIYEAIQSANREASQSVMGLNQISDILRKSQ